MKEAEKLPSMIPISKRDVCERTNCAKIKMISPKINPPKSALDIIPRSVCKMLIPVNNEMATKRLDPVLIPKILGSARVFLKIVCINKPANDNPAPAMMAIISRGMRRSCAMMC